MDTPTTNLVVSKKMNLFLRKYTSMKHISIFLFAVFFSTCLFAQKETFDLATFTVPAGWKKNIANTNVVSYVITNNQKGTYCQVGIYASTASKGNLRADFD